MALQFRLTERNAWLETLLAATGASALLRIYDATGGVPANVAAGIGSTVLLAEQVCGATFGVVAAGVLTLNAIADDAAANATGTAAYFRMWKADGTTCMYQGTVTVTAGDGDLKFATISFVQNAGIKVTSATITAPGA